MIFDWNEDKNKQLKVDRCICFEDIVVAIDNDKILDILEHPNKKKYKDQFLLIIEFELYAYVVPALIGKETWFLKTIFPSRVYTKKYLDFRKS